MEKETYSTPEFVDYGAITELTKQGGVPNADVPQGADGTAYSPA